MVHVTVARLAMQEISKKRTNIKGQYHKAGAQSGVSPRMVSSCISLFTHFDVFQLFPVALPVAL